MADGKITLEATADEKGVKVGMRDIEASVKRMATSVEGIGEKAKIAMQKQFDSLSKLNNQLGQQEQKVEALKQRLEELSSQKVETDAYKKLGKEVDSIYEKTANLESELNGWRELGVPENSSTFQAKEKELRVLVAEMDKLEQKQEEMKSSGAAYMDPRSLSEYQSTASRLTVEEMRLDDMNNRLSTSFASTEVKIGEMNDKLEEAKAKEIQAAEEAKRLKEIADNAEVSDEEIVALNEELQQLLQRQKELSAAGVGLGYEEFDLNEERISEINTELKDYKKWLTEAEEETNEFSSSFEKMSQKLMQSGISGMKKKIHEIGREIDNLLKKFLQLASGVIVGGLQKISSGIFAIHKSANKSTLSLKNLLKYAFGIRSLFALFNKLRSAATEGIQNLAQHDLLTNTGKVNKSLSELMSALALLKNSFATAFAPLLTVVSPILVQFINLISQAVTKVGMLIAALTGQTTFTKAIAVQENYAASLDKTANSAKKAAKALQGYLSPIDEINRYDDGSSSDSGNGSGGGYSGPSASDMFEEVPIENSLKGIADKIKKLVKDEDWEGLGAYIADGINLGLQKIYNVINWDNVGPRVTKFITAFTTTFNSLVDHIDWDLMGRTVGAGINTIVKSLNLAITGIDWYNLGKKFAIGIKGIVNETNWNELGQLIGNKFMAAWRTFGGFVKNLPYRSIGRAVADGLNGVFKTISFSEIADYLTAAINGAFTSLEEFTKDFEWDDFAENVKNGITDFINGINWKENGQAFGEFLKKLCETINKSITKDTFYDLGKGIGDFLGELPWGELLKTAGKTILNGIVGTLEGLWEGEGIPGKIAAVISAAFLAIKIADITGIGSLVKIIIGYIGKKIAESKNAELIAEKLASVLGDGTSGAKDAIESIGKAAETASTGGLSAFASKLTEIFGTAGIVFTATAVSVKLAKGIASVTEAAQGGNGILSQTGGYLHDYTGEMEAAHKITRDQAEELWNLIEADESAGKSNAEMYDSFIQKLSEYGISADKAKQILEQYGTQAGVFAEFVEDMTEKVQTLGEGFSESSGQIDASSMTAKDAIKGLKDILYELSLKSDDFGGTYQNVRDQLENTQGSVTTAQEAFDIVYNALKDANVPLDELNTALAETFPEAIVTAKASTESSMQEIESSVETGAGAASTAIANATSSIQKNSETGFGAASAAAGSAMAGIQKDTEESMSAAEKAVSDHTGNISKDSDRNWATAEGFATGAMENVGQYTYDKMKEVYGVVTRYNSSIENDFDQKWGNSKTTVVTAIQNMAFRVADNCSTMVTGVENAFSGIPDYISRIMNSAVGRVNTAVGNINNTIGNIERGFTFSYNVQLPNGGRRWGNYRLNLPRVNTVPYLATGAVIPPRSEFLAVLGDQKNGKNLEAPEGLLRQIVRDESGGKQGNNTYNVSVSASGRNLLDIILEEGELRRNRNGGRNPFKLDED